MNNYEIINSQVIFVYQRALNIRKRQFEFEDALKGLFKVPFVNIAIPDDQDGNIPRFEASSKHGFSKLQVSQFRTNLITNFEDKYRIDVDLIKGYLSERIPKLKRILKQEKSNFVAFIIELGFQIDAQDKINNILKRYSGANCINEGTNNFSISYSREYKEDYYINVKCSKYTEGKFKFEDGRMVSVGDEQKNGISVILDINSKLAHNKKKEYDFDIVDSLEKETFEILKTYKLEDYLQGNIN